MSGALEYAVYTTGVWRQTAVRRAAEGLPLMDNRFVEALN